MSTLFQRLLSGLLLVSALLWGGGALGQASFSDGGALEITAEEGIEWQREEQAYLARGNAVARRDDLTVRAEVLAAYYRRTDDGEERIFRIEAIGNLRVETANETVTGDRGIYYVDERVLRITGDDLRLETEGEEVTASESLEYFERGEDGPLAVARGDAVLRRFEEGQQVEGDVISARFSGDGGPSRTTLLQVEAEGDVRVTGDDVFASGDRGVYYVAEEKAVLDGDVRVTRGDSQLNGGRAEIDLRTGVSRLLATEGAPVRGLLSRDEGAPADGGAGGGAE
ncbi:MAG TPA: LptA/OstA family protein [Kiloniellales bacterium]|nr:LptA/OstA family protein [Kiloniellales bacterium]